jgi:hypothetical protein
MGARQKYTSFLTAPDGESFAMCHYGIPRKRPVPWCCPECEVWNSSERCNVCKVTWSTHEAFRLVAEFFAEDPVLFLEVNTWAHVCTCGALLMPKQVLCKECGAERLR